MAVRYTEEQLNSVDKSFLIHLLLQQQEQLEVLTKELHASNEKMQLLMEQVILGKQNRFGRSSEKMEDTNQICFLEVDGTIVFFNEAEAVCDLSAAEPEDLEPKSPKQPKRKGKKEADLSGLPVRRIDHYLSEAELEAEFDKKGWKQLPDAISRKYHFVPAKVEVEEHHIGVYASKTDEHMVKADHPNVLLHGSLVSPSLAAAVINDVLSSVLRDTVPTVQSALFLLRQVMQCQAINNRPPVYKFHPFLQKSSLSFSFPS